MRVLHVALAAALAILGGIPAPLSSDQQGEPADIVRRDVTAADRGRRLASFTRYATNGDEAIARAAMNAAMESDDWVLQSAVLRRLFTRGTGFVIELSASAAHPAADTDFLSRGPRIALNLTSLNHKAMSFTAAIAPTSVPETATARGGGLAGGGLGRGGGPVRGGGSTSATGLPLNTLAFASGQLLGTTLTVGNVWAGQTPCAARLSLDSPWTMRGFVHCQGLGSYAASMNLRSVAITDPRLREELEPWIDGMPPAERQRFLMDRDAKIRTAPPPRAWPVTDPVERRAIDADAKVVSELLSLLRQTDAAVVLGALEALVENGGPEATDLVIESGLASRHAAARAFALRIVLARSKTLLLEPAPGPEPAADTAKRATPFGIVIHKQYGVLEALGNKHRVEAQLPVAHLVELQSQFLIDGLLLAPFHFSEGAFLRITVNDAGEIRVESSVVDRAKTTRAGVVMDTRQWVVPDILR